MGKYLPKNGEKIFFFKFVAVLLNTMPRGGAKSLSGLSIKKNNLFTSSLTKEVDIIYEERMLEKNQYIISSKH